jgi:Mlc titration factor MtfA (ptsG expression regulator)
VFIAWEVIRDQARHPERGHNVVFHEFAHRLDALDGLFDGTPPLPGRRRARWISLCQKEFDLLRAGDGSTLLGTYAATNPAEFFAVATERFYTRPELLRADRPELYSTLAGYYRQDPVALTPETTDDTRWRVAADDEER